MPRRTCSFQPSATHQPKLKYHGCSVCHTYFDVFYNVNEFYVFQHKLLYSTNKLPAQNCLYINTEPQAKPSCFRNRYFKLFTAVSKLVQLCASGTDQYGKLRKTTGTLNSRLSRLAMTLDNEFFKKLLRILMDFIMGIYDRTTMLKTTYRWLVHRLMCLFAPQLSWYSFREKCMVI